MGNIQEGNQAFCDFFILWTQCHHEAVPVFGVEQFCELCEVFHGPSVPRLRRSGMDAEDPRVAGSKRIQEPGCVRVLIG